MLSLNILLSPILIRLLTKFFTLPTPRSDNQYYKTGLNTLENHTTSPSKLSYTRDLTLKLPSPKNPFEKMKHLINCAESFPFKRPQTCRLSQQTFKFPLASLLVTGLPTLRRRTKGEHSAHLRACFSHKAPGWRRVALGGRQPSRRRGPPGISAQGVPSDPPGSSPRRCPSALRQPQARAH